MEHQATESIFAFSALVSGKKHSAYRDLIYNIWKINYKFELFLPLNSYGNDIDTILLEFNDESWGAKTFSEQIKVGIKIGRYSAKQKAISIAIPVQKYVLDSVISGDIKIVNDFLVEIFTKIGGLITLSKSLSKLNFDIKKFNCDFQVFMQHLLDDAPAVKC